MLPPGPGGGDDFESPTLNTTNLVMPRPTQSSLDSTTAYYPAVKLDPVHQGGALFAGLSNSTTLTFNTIHYYESFPGLSEPDILVLATPSAEYDSDALNIYSHSLGTMPVGVKVGENGLGDWFAGIVSKIGGFLAPFLGPVLGTVAQVGAGMANQYLASQSPSGAVLKSTQAPTVPKKKKRSVSRSVAPPNGRGKGNKPIMNVPSKGTSRSKTLSRMPTRQLLDKGYTPRQAATIHNDGWEVVEERGRSRTRR